MADTTCVCNLFRCRIARARVPHAAAIKGVVDVPVIGVGGIVTAEVADRIIRSGRVDLVAVGRAYLSEPRWATLAVKELSQG